MKAYSVSIGHHQSSSESGIFNGIWKSGNGKHPEAGGGTEPEYGVGNGVVDVVVVEGEATVVVGVGDESVSLQLGENGEVKKEEEP